MSSSDKKTDQIIEAARRDKLDSNEVQDIKNIVWQKLKNANVQTSANQSELESIADFKAPTSENSNQTKKSVNKWLLSLAALVVLSVLASLIFLQSNVKSSKWVELEQPKVVEVEALGLPLNNKHKSESKFHELSDGTILELKSQTSARLVEEGSHRVIHLLKGSVLVEAAKQKQGTLKVQTKDCIVRVVGTVFSVSKENSTQVHVVEGKVQVDQAYRTTFLTAKSVFSTIEKDHLLSVSEQISWSQNFERYKVLLEAQAGVTSAQHLPKFKDSLVVPKQSVEKGAVIKKKGLSLKGRVVDEKHQPMKHTFVELELDPKRRLWRKVTTNENGEFEFSNLKKSEYQIRVNQPEYGTQKQEIIVDHSIENFEIVLKANSEITVKVYDSHQNLVKSAKVKLLWSPSLDSANYLTWAYSPKETDEKGRAIFKGLHKSYFVAKAMHEGQVAFSTPVYLPEQRVRKEVSLYLAPAPSVKGRLVDAEGKPISNVKIHASASYMYNKVSESDLSTISDQNGFFDFAGLNMGMYTFLVLNRDAPQYYFESVRETIREGQYEIKLVGEEVQYSKIKVVTPEGEPHSEFSLNYISNNIVKKINLEKEGQIHKFLVQRIFSDGPKRLVVRAKGYNPGYTEMLTLEQALEKEIVVKLKTLKKVEVFVTDATGLALPRTKIQLRRIYEKETRIDFEFNFYGTENKEYVTDEHGRCVLMGIEPSKYAIRLSKEGYGGLNTYRVLDPSDQGLKTLVLSEGVGVKGQVVRNDGAPVEEMTIIFSAIKENSSTIEREYSVKSDSKGNYHFDRVVPGNYRVIWYDKQNGEKRPNVSSIKHFPIFSVKKGEENNYGINTHQVSGELQLNYREKHSLLQARIINLDQGKRYEIMIKNNQLKMKHLPLGNYNMLLMSKTTAGIVAYGKRFQIQNDQDHELEINSRTKIIINSIYKNGKAILKGELFLVPKEIESGDRGEVFKRSAGIASIADGKAILYPQKSGSYDLYFGSLSGKDNLYTDSKVDVDIIEGEELILERVQF